MQGFRAFRAHKDSGKVIARLDKVSLDDLSAGDVVIRTVYSSVNYKDALAATGSGKIMTRFPLVPGIDVAGYVHSSDDPRYPPGSRVLATGFDIGVGHDGGYSEFTRLPSEWILPVPASLSLHDAMALGTAGLTVALCVKRFLDNGQAPENGPIVVTGATGGVGSIAVDILSGLGFQVAAVTGKRQGAELLQRLGADSIIYRDELQFGERPLERATWAGAIDNVGGDMLTWLTRTVMPWGNICSVGLAGGSHLVGTVMPFLLRGIALLGVTASGCPRAWREELWRKLATDWRPRHLELIVGRTIGLDALPDVFHAMLRGEVLGRTLVLIGEDREL